MVKKSTKEVFKGMRLAYMTFAVLGIIFGILLLAAPNVSETLEKALPDLAKSLGTMSVKTYFLVSIGFGVLVDIFYFYLITRCADGKSKGTLLLVLLVLRVLTAIVALITTKTSINLGAIIDAVTLFFLVRFKKESE